jgi:hypothetical protein
MVDFYTPIDAYREAENFKTQQQHNALAQMMEQINLQRAQRALQDEQAMRQATQGAFNPQTQQFDFGKLMGAYAQKGDIEGALKAQQLRQQAESQKAFQGLLSGQQAQPISAAQPGAMQSMSGMQPGAIQNAPTEVAAPQQKPISEYQKYMQFGQRMMARGGPADIALAKQMFDLAKEIKPEVRETKTFTDPQTGKRMVVNLLKDNSYEVLPFNPDAEKAHFADVGGSIAALDPYTGRPIGAGIQKTMTPGEIATNQRAAQAQEQGRWQYDSQSGMAINAVTGEARPIIGPQGELGKKEKLTADQQKTIDSTTAGISTLDRAIGLVKQQPQVFTQGRGAMINLPWIGGPGMESLLGKGDTPQEQSARGAVFQEAAMVAHELLGASQSPAERASVQPFLPSQYDNAQQIVSKLEGLKQISELRRSAVLQGKQQKASEPAAPTEQKQQVFNSLPDPRQYKGRTIMNPDTGMRMTSTGSDWVRAQ